MNKTVSNAIDFIRFPLAVGVVAIHCNHYGFELSNAFTSAIVPVFMMISGLLLYRGGIITFRTSKQ